MKKIITTVGTSLLSNAEKHEFEVRNYKYLTNKSYNDSNDEEVLEKTKKIKKELDKYIQSSDTSLSAEIASIVKIKQEIKEDIEVYLLATDTVLAPLCAEYIKKYFNNEIIVHFNKEKHIIKSLQVQSKDNFEKIGVPNLLSELDNIAQNGFYWDDIILNITGGYKGIIPIMTIIGQVYNLPVYYIFEENENQKCELIKIAKVPLSFNYSIFDKFYDIFAFIEAEEICEIKSLKKDFVENVQSCLINDEKNETCWFSPIGRILWEKFKKQFFIFYCPNDIWNEIKNQKEITRILETKFYNPSNRKIEAKSEHKTVHDDGNNPNRIYFFEKQNKLYIYKTFENHDQHERFLKTPFNEKVKEQIIINSFIRKIKVQ